jgi:Raf kinase inhibitor-like YbhB/YbcL family protein
MPMRSKLGSVGLALSALLALGGCGKGRSPAPPPAPPETMRVTSPTLQDGQPMPAVNACTDEAHLGKSPPIAWTKGPPETVAYAVSMVDPDAKNFVHWVVTGIPADVTSLPEGASPGGPLPAGALELRNDFEKSGYGGPCPPPDSAHHYIVQVWALRRPVATGQPDAAFFQELVTAAAASGKLTVTFQR